MSPQDSWHPVKGDNLNEIIIFRSAEDCSFVAEVPELLGCMTDGRIYQAAVGHAEVAIQEWIDTARELGRGIPKPKGRFHYA
ncbi:MAG: type II toxin-antitoxin system HicB family antitoxin [Gammaproteobacteria bacterium]|nr:MAG: type II toxin-antitoxin system HicB family antitoxin [Gammaproteobacteria bacterium]